MKEAMIRVLMTVEIMMTLPMMTALMIAEVMMTAPMMEAMIVKTMMKVPMTMQVTDNIKLGTKDLLTLIS